MSTPRLIYLHGFLSSPLSAKAQQLGRYLAEREPELEYVVPALPEQPQLALAAAGHAVAQALADGRAPALIGSSMGGFYATVLAERHALRTVLVNPSVRPQLRLSAYFGENHNPYSGHRFVLDETHAAALTEMAPLVLAQPANYWLLAQSGDEVLDYREAVEFYAGCRQTIESGGDHQFQGFERHLPDIVAFLR